jgi:hypothetical protein
LSRTFPARLAFLIACLACVCAVPARAMNVDGKFGIGFEETLTAIGVQQSQTLDDHASGTTPLPDLTASGLTARYYHGNVGFELIFGAVIHHPSGADWEYTLLLSPGVFYNVFRAPSVNLSFGGRFLNAWSQFNDAGGHSVDGRYGFAVELPLRVEYFFSPAFAISGAVGPVITRNGASSNPLTGNTNSLDVTLTRGSFSGGIGFTYYIN